MLHHSLGEGTAVPNHRLGEGTAVPNHHLGEGTAIPNLMASKNRANSCRLKQRNMVIEHQLLKSNYQYLKNEEIIMIYGTSLLSSQLVDLLGSDRFRAHPLILINKCFEFHNSTIPSNL